MAGEPPKRKDPTMEVDADELTSASAELPLDDEPTRTAENPLLKGPPEKPLAAEKTKFGKPPAAPPASVAGTGAGKQGKDLNKSTMSALLDELEEEVIDEVEALEEPGPPPPPPRPSQRPPA